MDDVKNKLSTIFDGIDRLDYKMQEFCFERHPVAAALIFGSVMLGTAYELAHGFNDAYARKEEYQRKMEKPALCIPVTNPDLDFVPK